MWNRILTAEKPVFNTQPNAFLVEMVKGRAPGTALDVGMGRDAMRCISRSRDGRSRFRSGGQGRGAGERHRREARRQVDDRHPGIRGLRLRREPLGSDLLSYLTVRDIADRIVRALKPGGIVVVEAFHRDVTRERPVGGGVVFDSNELLNLFGKLRVLRYEDADATSDFGGAGSRAVRLCAMKEDRRREPVLSAPGQWPRATISPPSPSRSCNALHGQAMIEKG